MIYFDLYLDNSFTGKPDSILNAGKKIKVALFIDKILRFTRGQKFAEANNKTLNLGAKEKEQVLNKRSVVQKKH